MWKFIENFRHSERGAVTVDWIVLTAAIIGLAVAVFSALSTSAPVKENTAPYLHHLSNGGVSAER
ncbi:MAG: hypothetical protein AAF755_06275 [Pseudomonadota bacterium]